MAQGRFVIPYKLVHYQPDEWTAVQAALEVAVESMRPSEDGEQYEGVGESPHFQNDTIVYDLLALLPGNGSTEPTSSEAMENAGDTPV